MAYCDSEHEFFTALTGGELKLRANGGYFTTADRTTNANGDEAVGGQIRALSAEYSIEKIGWGRTGYLVHTHQQGYKVVAAHVKDESYGKILFRFTDIDRLEQALPAL